MVKTISQIVKISIEIWKQPMYNMTITECVNALEMNKWNRQETNPQKSEPLLTPQ